MYSYNIANAHGLAMLCFLCVVIPAIIGGFVSKRGRTVDLWRQIFDSGGNRTANNSQLITIYPLNPLCDNQKFSTNKKCKLNLEGCSQFWHAAKWSLLGVQYFIIPSFPGFLYEGSEGWISYMPRLWINVQWLITGSCQSQTSISPLFEQGGKF